uniref:Uncharacterized protein n=1 Tax=Cannabis sativa TaxID=3483 RepID=A0A803R0T3_CANSA
MCIENINLPHILESNCSTFLNNDKLHSQRSLLEKSLKPNLIQLDLNIKNLPPPPEASKFGCWTYKNLLVYYWANDKTVQEALHIQKETIQIWIRCNRSLPYAKDVDSVVSYHKQLNSRGYRALIYSGDHDMVVPYLGTLAWIKSMNLSIVDRWRPWLVDNQVAGERSYSSRVQSQRMLCYVREVDFSTTSLISNLISNLLFVDTHICVYVRILQYI